MTPVFDKKKVQVLVIRRNVISKQAKQYDAPQCATAVVNLFCAVKSGFVARLFLELMPKDPENMCCSPGSLNDL